MFISDSVEQADVPTTEFKFAFAYLVAVAVMLLVFTTPFGNEATDGWIIIVHRALLVGIIALCSIKLGTSEVPDFGMKNHLLVGASLLVMFLAIFWGTPGSTFDGFYAWYHHVLFALFFLLLVKFNHSQPLAWKGVLLAMIIATIVIHCAWSLIPGDRPLLGFFVNSNYFGSYMLVGFASSLAISIHHSSLRCRFSATLTAAFLLYGISQTLSRGALLGAFAVALLAAQKLGRRVRLAVVLGFLILLVGFSPRLVEKFTDLGVVDPYNYLRPQIWMNTLEMIGERPLTGVGLERYGEVASRFPVPAEGAIARYAKRHEIAHSEYLHYVAEIGIPGSLLLFSMFGYFFWSLARLRSRPPSADSFLNDAGFLSAAGVGLHAFVDNNFTVPVVAATLAVVSLARFPLTRRTRLWFPVSLKARTAGVLILAVLFLHSTLIPGIAVHFNDSAPRAYVTNRFEKAERAHRLAVTLAPDHPLFLSNLGSMYLARFARTGDSLWLDAADAFFSRAIAANPNSVVPQRQRHVILVQRLSGTESQRRGLLNQLLDNSKKIIEIDPVSVVVRRNLAEALHEVGEREAAIQELITAIGLEPNFVPAYRRLADWYRLDREFEKADAFAERADEIAESFRDAQVLNAYEADLLGQE